MRFDVAILLVGGFKGGFKPTSPMYSSFVRHVLGPLAEDKVTHVRGTRYIEPHIPWLHPT